MIQKLQIKNFQSHKNSTLEFDSNVNVILGASDSGKTAIIRALRWVVFNRPQGDSFCSNWGGGETSVEIKTDNNTIIRSKDKNKVNKYILDKQKFQALRTEVPEQIKEVLNINKINIHQQLSAPFLLSDSAGEVAQQFNKIAHLDVIDTSIQNVQRWIKNISSTLALKENRATQLQEIIEQQYSNLDELDGRVFILEREEKKKNTLCQKQKALRILISNIQQVEEETAELNQITKAEKVVNLILKLIEDKEKLVEKGLELTTDLLQYTSIMQRYTETKEDLIVYQKQFKKEFPKDCPLCGKPK